MKIDKSKWAEFDFDNVFWLKRGKRLVTQNQIEGNIAYISSTKINNGIDNYINPPDDMKIYNNAITLNNSGSIGYCFYHTYDFVASDHCTVLKIRDEKIKLNNYSFLFLKPIIETMKSKYGFAREMSDDRLKKEKIILPALKKGSKYSPDWFYMQKYIKFHSTKVVYNKNIQNPKKSISLDSVKWEEFEIGKIFKVTGTKTTPKQELEKYGDGIYPYVTTKATNNAIHYLYNYFTEKGNVLVIDSATIGHTTYQELAFSASDHVEKLVPTFKMNKYIALFILTILNKEQYRYGYGRKFNQQRIKKQLLNYRRQMVSPILTLWKNISNHYPIRHQLTPIIVKTKKYKQI